MLSSQIPAITAIVEGITGQLFRLVFLIPFCILHFFHLHGKNSDNSRDSDSADFMYKLRTIRTIT